MKYFLPLILSGFFSYSSTAQWKGFSEYKAYPVSKKVTQFHTKDISGDGIPDITTFYTAADLTMGILQGNGSGLLLSEQTQFKEDNYFLSDIADLNNDGLPDMVISSYWANGFKIYFGNKTGKFSDGIYVATAVHGRAIKCVDINKDGKMDIVGVSSGSGRTISLHVFIGNGDGSFQPKRSFPSVLDTSKNIFITDKNGDGLLDVVVSSSFSWFVIFYQKEDRSFEPGYFPTYTTARLNFYDFNKDGKEDLLMLYPSFDNEPGSDSMSIKLNTGGSDFSTSIRLPQLENRNLRPYNVRVADINRDGFADIFVDQNDIEGYDTDTIYYMLGGPGLVFSAPASIVMPAGVSTFDLADMNDDGKQDLIVSCVNKNMYVLLNDVSDTVDPSQVLIYPNPARGFIKIKGLPDDTRSISIYNTSGQIIRRFSSIQNTRINTNSFSAGIYYLEIKMDHQKITRSFVIQ